MLIDPHATAASEALTSAFADDLFLSEQTLRALAKTLLIVTLRGVGGLHAHNKDRIRPI